MSFTNGQRIKKDAAPLYQEKRRWTNKKSHGSVTRSFKQ